ncbi:hypothetical protein ACRRTK_018865 [Alexandromys fortis]
MSVNSTRSTQTSGNVVNPSEKVGSGRTWRSWSHPQREENCFFSLPWPWVRNKTARGTAFRYWKYACAMGSDDAHNWYDPRQTECAVSVDIFRWLLRGYKPLQVAPSVSERGHGCPSKRRSEAPPHVFAVADRALQDMLRNLCSLSVHDGYIQAIVSPRLHLPSDILFVLKLKEEEMTEEEDFRGLEEGCRKQVFNILGWQLLNASSILSHYAVLK